MYFAQTLAIVALAVFGVEACTAGEFRCGNRGGAPGPDGAIYVCNASGRWQFSSQCGGRTCCQGGGSNVHCVC
ncbi:hypothetical protein MY5147_000290 [Beauveria neobassiana]|uniref:Uncharacterized protein n=1 Tax=Beauveria bassiana D1-5 TaxID=1245745 RepID=A0A0A2VMQ3_BEABA|nr:hypothetical protein BBAD15_g5743 [Beauveria bassiana D1-5]